jgi:hypothetical protein
MLDTFLAPFEHDKYRTVGSRVIRAGVAKLGNEL